MGSPRAGNAPDLAPFVQRAFCLLATGGALQLMGCCNSQPRPCDVPAIVAADNIENVEDGPTLQRVPTRSDSGSSHYTALEDHTTDDGWKISPGSSSCGNLSSRLAPGGGPGKGSLDWASEMSPAQSSSRGTKPMDRRFSDKSMRSLSSDLSILSLPQVAAGHGGTSILKYVERNADFVPDIAQYVMKAYDEDEARVYEELEGRDDALLSFTARFFGEVDPAALATEDLNGRYMRLSNLLKKFQMNPHVMDCKIGIRSFGEAEIQNSSLRKDLYKRLVDLDPLEPTPEERTQEACTKHRWMAFNDSRTTLARFGFRIDGIARSDGRSVGKSSFKALKELSDVSKCIIQNFLPPPSVADSNEGDTTGSSVTHTVEAVRTILSDLRKLRDVMYASDFVRTHSFVGSSLLFAMESNGPGAGVYMIDFAKTVAVPEKVTVDHRSPWQPGNHEDGLYIGMDNMIRCWEMVRQDIDPEAANILAISLGDGIPVSEGLSDAGVRNGGRGKRQKILVYL